MKGTKNEAAVCFGPLEVVTEDRQRCTFQSDSQKSRREKKCELKVILHDWVTVEDKFQMLAHVTTDLFKETVEHENVGTELEEI